MSEATRLKLIEATLDCLTERGYASTSTHEVAKRAGVTRGALNHHYANKAELIADAAAHLVRQRSIKIREATSNDESRDLREQIKLKYDIYQDHFPAMIEFMVAARTDADLREAFSGALTRQYEDGWEQSQFTEFASRPDPVMCDYVVNCFIRGLSLETIVNPPERVERIFDEFIELLTLALGAGGRNSQHSG
ncbi:TetR/AcrR family transcriptional regulator [Maricaulaceae bacterium NA33B04]|nr:TetR/AcrR family transcriptional regulator [Maricaulaceae bacterium NA33B04]